MIELPDYNHKENMNYKEFCEELEKILSNHYNEGFPQENIRTVDFIEAMQAWLSIDGGKDCFLDFEKTKISYRDLLELIRASGMYE